jgi:hypothetical protein
VVQGGSKLLAGIVRDGPDYGLLRNEEQIDAANRYVLFSILPFDADRIKIELPGMSQPRAQQIPSTDPAPHSGETPEWLRSRI